MNVKRYILAAIAVFLVSQALEYLIHGVILMSTYESLEELWRPDMESKMWIYPVIGAIWSLLFTYIFIKGREGRGLMEGVRFGVVIGLFVGIPMAYGTYAMIEIPYSLALQWWIYTLIECIILGVIAAAVYKPLSAPAPGGETAASG